MINGEYRRISYSCTQEFVIPHEIGSVRSSESSDNLSKLLLQGDLPSSDDSDLEEIDTSTYKNLNSQLSKSQKCQTLNCDGSGSTRLKTDGKSFYKTHQSLDNCPKKIDTKAITLQEEESYSELKRKLQDANEK